MNAELEWFADFIEGNIPENMLVQIEQEAQKRLNAIAEEVQKNPEAPGTIAERTLEWWLHR